MSHKHIIPSYETQVSRTISAMRSTCFSEAVSLREVQVATT